MFCLLRLSLTKSLKLLKVGLNLQSSCFSFPEVEMRLQECVTIPSISPLILKVTGFLKFPELLSLASLWCHLGSRPVYSALPTSFGPWIGPPDQVQVNTAQPLLTIYRFSHGSEDQASCGRSSLSFPLVYTQRKRYLLFLFLVQVPRKREIRARVRL